MTFEDRFRHHAGNLVGGRMSRRGLFKGAGGAAGAALLASRGFRGTVAADRVKLSLLAQGDSWDPDNIYLPKIEEAVGIDLDFQMVPSADYTEKRNVVMASGDYPDAIRIQPSETVYYKYIDQGLLRPLDDLLDAYPTIRDAYSADVWEINRYPKDGKIYHIPRLTGFYPITIAYRKDWADALGIAPPTTTDEFAAMLKAFKDENPGQVKDLIPFTPNRSDVPAAISWLGPFLSAFGADLQAWQPPTPDSEDLAFSSAQPGYKDALQYLRQLRDDELLDPGFLVTKDRGLFKFYAGQVGATTDWPQFMDLRLEAVKSVQPEGEIAYLVGLTGPNGTVGGPLWNPGDQSLGSALTVGAGDEQAEAFFKMLTWQYTDGYELMTLGVEGVTFDVVNGRKVRRGRDQVLKDDPHYDLYMLDRVFFAEPPSFFVYSQESPGFAQVPDDIFTYVSGVLDEVEQRKHIDYLLNVNDPAILDNQLHVEDAVVEVAAKFILNPDLDADKEFTSYLDRLKQSGIDEMTEAVNSLNEPTLPSSK